MMQFQCLPFRLCTAPFIVLSYIPVQVGYLAITRVWGEDKDEDNN